MLPGTLSLPQKALKLKKTTFWGDFWLKTAPHRRFGGSGVAEIFIFLSSNKKCTLFVKKFFSISHPQKVMELHKKITRIESARFVGINIPQKPRNSFSKVPSNFAVADLIWGYCLSTPGEGPRPPKSLIGGSWVQKNSFCKKIKNRTIFEGKLPSLSALPENPQKARNSFSKSPSKFSWFSTFQRA